MASNVEIKMRLRSLDAVLASAARLSNGPVRLLEQVDTFFACPEGRLKLRRIEGDHAELIAYHRSDSVGPRESRYEVVPVCDAAGLRRVLAAALGERVTVRKRRHLFMVGQTRIHVDDVKDLGSFLELEVVLREGQTVAEGQSVLRGILESLEAHGDEVRVAYADLLAQADEPQGSTSL